MKVWGVFAPLASRPRRALTPMNTKLNPMGLPLREARIEARLLLSGL
eukprot:CAMPEP_0114323558 /NCGR_PEP_ID=MMETSP0059-20121206/27949_1 /TAXON_ID=36894 /ORGANISM="Pyramimonas parkeae, Strain CCMP726" /LENGTH=46 /DNA_ID= /DNA_START= /DNA_END= /DNA_ORIENTATION=